MAIPIIPKLESSAARARKARRGLFIPSWIDTFLYLILSLWVLLITNLDAFLKFYSQKVAGNQDAIGKNLGAGLGAASNYLDRVTGFRFAGLILWFFIGLMIYCLIWLVRNIYINLRNDFAAARYVNPYYGLPVTTLTGNKYWQTVLFSKSALAGSLVCLSLVGYLSLKLLPKFSADFYQGITALWSPSKIYLAVLALIAVAALVYAILLLLKLARLFWINIQKGL